MRHEHVRAYRKTLEESDEASAPNLDSAGRAVRRVRGTEQVLEKGACVQEAQLPPSQAARVAEVDRALAGTDADRAAANLRLLTTAELAQKFPRELAAHAAACRGQQAKTGGAVCDGGVTPGGATVLVCSTAVTTCVYI